MRTNYFFIALLFSAFIHAQTFNNVTALSQLNTAVGDSYPWLSSNGLHLYYTSGTGTDGCNIYFSQRPDTASPFGAPAQLDLGGLTNFVSIWLSDDEKDAYLTTFDSQLFYAHRDNLSAGFTNLVSIALLGADFLYFKGPSLNAEQNKMIVTAGGHIYELSRTTSTAFTYTNTIDLPPGINPSPGQLSKDGLSYVFSETTDGFGQMGRLTRASSTDAFVGASFTEFNGINSSDFSSTQPSLSNNLEWLVFVRNSDGSWAGNDLYVAHNTDLAVSIPELRNKAVVFPNPSDGFVTIQWEQQSIQNSTLEVFNMTGKRVLQMPFAASLDLSGFEKGCYFLKITGEGFSDSEKIILE